MTQPIRWGVLGASDFARRVTAPAIHAASGAVFAALATRRPDAAAPFTAFAPGLRVHDSYEALLADPQIDAVYIPLSNHLHVEYTLAAAAAGKAVLCEKPIAMQEAEFDALIRARDTSGLLIAEAYMILHHPQWHRARALIADGAIGELHHVEGAFSFDNRDMSDIRNQAETGGGALRDIGVYTIGSARFVTGAEPARVTARMTWQNGVDTHVEATADLGPARLTFRLSTRMALWQEMTFHGTAGLIRLPAPFNPVNYGEASVQLMRPNRDIVIERFTTAQQYVTQVESFGASMRTGAPYPVPLEFSRGTQAAIDAVFAAAPPR